MQKFPSKNSITKKLKEEQRLAKQELLNKLLLTLEVAKGTAKIDNPFKLAANFSETCDSYIKRIKTYLDPLNNVDLQNDINKIFDVISDNPDWINFPDVVNIIATLRKQQPESEYIQPTSSESNSNSKNPNSHWIKNNKKVTFPGEPELRVKLELINLLIYLSENNSEIKKQVYDISKELEIMITSLPQAIPIPEQLDHIFAICSEFSAETEIGKRAAKIIQLMNDLINNHDLNGDPSVMRFGY